jgi:hypothetical protein
VFRCIDGDGGRVCKGIVGALEDVREVEGSEERGVGVYERECEGLAIDEGREDWPCPLDDEGREGVRSFETEFTFEWRDCREDRRGGGLIMIAGEFLSEEVAIWP